MFRACAAVIRAGLLCAGVLFVHFVLSTLCTTCDALHNTAMLGWTTHNGWTSLASPHVNVGRVTHTTHARTRVAIDNEGNTLRRRMQCLSRSHLPQ